jgi:hypothetical protein
VRVIVRNPPSPADRAAVAWDVDSTVWDFLSGFYDLAHARHGALLPARAPATGTWAYVTERIGHDAAIALLPDVYDADYMGRYGPLPGAVEATHAARAAGARVVVMTHRPPEAADGTARFLDEAGFHWDELRCGFDCKVTACRAMGIDVIVDDRPETIELAVERGLQVLTISWHWTDEVCARLPVRHAPDYARLTPLVLEAIERAAAAATRAAPPD